MHIEFKIIAFIKVHKFKIKKHNVCEYVVIFIYILNNNNKVTLIRHEIHIVNDLFVKAFIKIDIMKSKDIVFDINKDFIIIELYDSLQVLMFMIIKGL